MYTVRDGKESEIPETALKDINKIKNNNVLIEAYNIELESLFKENKALKKKLYANYKIRFKK